MMFRPMRLLIGTVLLAAAGVIVWGLQKPREAADAVPSLVNPPEAVAQVITPGSVVAPKLSANISERVRKNSAAASARQSPLPATTEDEWNVIVLDDQRIGWTRIAQSETKREGMPVIRIVTEMSMQFRRFGQKFDMQKTLTTEETPAGDLLGYTLEVRNPPAAPTTTTATVSGGEIRIDSLINGKNQTSRFPWNPEVRAPAWQDRYLKTPPMKPGDKREFKSYFPDFHKVGTVKAAADQKQMVKLLDGRQKLLLKIRTSNSLAPELTSRSFVDEEGRTWRFEEDLLGKTMVTYKVSEEEALKKLTGADLDLAVNTLIPTSAIREAHQTQKVVYRISMKGGDPSRHFHESASQKVKALTGESIELTVTAPVRPKAGKPTPAEPKYLESSRYLQADDALVKEHARKACGSTQDPLQSALLMEKYVHQNLARKNFSTALASAAEVATSLEGDCTEHAVLLAAMLRSREIPSRVVVGLVYVEGVQAFGAHLWTEAWIAGEWFPLDATLGRGGIRAAHIRIADASLNDNGPTPVSCFMPLLRILGQVKIEVVQSH